MFGNVPTNSLTLGKVVSGISKSLSVANQLIPLYKEVKPVFSNAKTILNTLKELGNTTPKGKVQNYINNNATPSQKKDIFLTENISNNKPVFFK